MREQRRPGGPALSRRTVLSAGAALAAFGATAACGRSERVTERPPSGEDPQTIVSDAYVFGYPLVLMDATRRVARASTPDNQFRHAAGLPTPRRRGPVRPNMDTLYSIAWLDLSAGPMVVQMPEVEPQRYWVLQLLDAWTNTVHNPGNLRPRVAAGAAPPYTYVVTGPGWTGELPPDLVVLPMPTPMVWLLGRIQVDGPEDVPAVRAIQERMRLVPLADWPAGRDPGPGRTDTGDGDVPPVQQVAAMDPAEFFERLCALMAVNPPAPADGPALARFAQLGIAPGGALTGISDDDLAEAVQAVRHTIEVYVDPGIRIDNGWLVDPNIGVYGDDYLRRASTAAKGLGANRPESAAYPTLFAAADDDGIPTRYRLTFAPGQAPPVDAFWSVTAYDGDGFLVPNDAEIYSVGHRIPVPPAPDGSLVLVIQHADPGPGVPAGSWLPIPDRGTFSLTLRLYAPKTEMLDGSWHPPPLVPVP
ncbi:DUF1254 domain-containing protein [Nocardia farcinica]|uniref:DUF1254 domain-containing protein n=1 Tax=Nocardia farcinica TaxID=37329 RepID=UPI002457E35D|nr:DUF1254 domain-containing protein [Nocardia farcinica]